MAPGIGRRSRSRSSSRSVSSEQGSNIGDSSNTPERRGLALNKELNDLIKGGMIRPKIDFKPGLAKPVCQWGKQFIREVGIVVRTRAPLACHRWKDIKKNHDVKSLFYDKISKKFDVNFDNPSVREIVNKQMGESLRLHRCRMYRHYKSLGVNKRGNPPKNMADAPWAEICDWFESEEFKKLSEKNSANIKEKVIYHRGGAKSFAVYFEERKEKEMELVAAREAAGEVDTPEDADSQEGRIEFYRRMHYNEQKGWISTLAEDNYVKMLELKNAPPVEGKKPMTEDEIYVEVLGKRRGFGNGVLSTSQSMAYNSHNVEFEEYKRNAEEERRQLTEKLENLQTRQVRTEALLAQIANNPALQSCINSGETSR